MLPLQVVCNSTLARCLQAGVTADSSAASFLLLQQLAELPGKCIVDADSYDSFYSQVLQIGRCCRLERAQAHKREPLLWIDRYCLHGLEAEAGML